MSCFVTLWHVKTCHATNARGYAYDHDVFRYAAADCVVKMSV